MSLLQPCHLSLPSIIHPSGCAQPLISPASYACAACLQKLISYVTWQIAARLSTVAAGFELTHSLLLSLLPKVVLCTGRSLFLHLSSAAWYKSCDSVGVQYLVQFFFVAVEKVMVNVLVILGNSLCYFKIPLQCHYWPHCMSWPCPPKYRLL